MDDYAKWLETLNDKQLSGQARVARTWLGAEELHGTRQRINYAERLGQIETELALRAGLPEELG